MVASDAGSPAFRPDRRDRSRERLRQPRLEPPSGAVDHQLALGAGADARPAGARRRGERAPSDGRRLARPPPGGRHPFDAAPDVPRAAPRRSGPRKSGVEAARRRGRAPARAARGVPDAHPRARRAVDPPRRGGGRLHDAGRTISRAPAGVRGEPRRREQRAGAAHARGARDRRRRSRRSLRRPLEVALAAARWISPRARARRRPRGTRSW